MTTYRVRFASNAHPYNIQRATERAANEGVLRAAYAVTGCRIIDIETAPEYDEQPSRETMERRSNVISAALKGDPLSPEQADELWRELAEIATWLQKDDQSIGDYADAQTCARFSDQL